MKAETCSLMKARNKKMWTSPRFALPLAWLLALLALPAGAATVKPSQAPSATTATKGDFLFLTATNSGAATFTTKKIAVADLMTNVIRRGNVKLFGAAGDGATDDSTVISNLASVCNELYFPAGTYRLNRSLNLPYSRGVKWTGEGPGRTILFFYCNTNGVQYVRTQGQGERLENVTIEKMTIRGQTNANTGSGLFFGDFTAGSGPNNVPVAMGIRVSDVDIEGFAEGLSLSNTVTAVLETVRVQGCTNSSFSLYRADSTWLNSCWGGMTAGYANDRVTALKVTGTSLGVHVLGGEWGNCMRGLYIDSGEIAILGGNAESFYGTEENLITNTVRFSEFGRNHMIVSGSNIPIWRLTANPGGQPASCIKVINPIFNGYTTNAFSIEGNVSDLPGFWSDQVTQTNIVKRASIGGAITATYKGNSVPDVNIPQEWTGKQTLKGLPASAGALRIPNSYLYGGLELGADSSGLDSVTASTAKYFSMNFPRYADDANSAFTAAGIHYAADGSGNYLRIGGNGSSSFGMTLVRFATASAVNAVSTDRWQIDSSGNFYALAGGAKFSAWNSVFQHGGATLQLGADDAATTLSANALKRFQIQAPGYTASTIDHGALSWLADTDSKCYLDIGHSPSQYGANYIRFWTAPTVNATAANIAQFDMNGVFRPTGGGIGYNFTSAQAANYQILGSACFVRMNGNLTATLPNATTNSGVCYTIKTVTAGTNAILTLSAQTIDGATKWTNTAVGKYTTVLSDGGNWVVVGQN